LLLGCPQKIAKRGNYGAYLLQDQDRVLSCLKAMVKELNVPITAKIRRLATDEATLNLCRALEDCGISMLTLHGRTVDNSKLYITAADWEIIRKVKSVLKIPVIANGGISCREDALRCLEQTGADGVMSSEALLENPRLFSAQGDAYFRNDYVKCQIETTKEYLEIVQSYPLPRPLFQVVRSHLFKFLYRFVDAPLHTDLRQLLAEGTFEDMKRVVLLVEERLSTVDFNTELAESKGLLNSKSWYNRHRDEKALLRVLSPRKNKSPKVIQSLSAEAIEAERKSKMEVLRKRLELRKLSQ
jgi:tRNA-dihydrouridine synthase